MAEASREQAIGQAMPAPMQPTVVADVHEPIDLVSSLARKGVVVERQKLAPADFLVGPLAIERKSVGDFHQSLLSKRLFEQLARMKQTYPPPVALLLEGDLAQIASRQNPSATWGALCAIALDLEVAILPTPDREGSADLLATLARRMAKEGRRAEVRFKPRMLSEDAAQRFAVQGLPGIGDVVSDSLLERFGSVRRVFTGHEKDFLKVPGIGKVRAREMDAFLDSEYSGRQARFD